MDISTKVGTAAGAVAGVSKYLISINSDFLLKMAESGFVAIISGAMGALGSFLMVQWINSKYKKNGKSEKETGADSKVK